MCRYVGTKFLSSPFVYPCPPEAPPSFSMLHAEKLGVPQGDKCDVYLTTWTNSLILVNCGSPPLPPNGFIIVPNNTIEGSLMSFICLTSDPETVYTTVCNQEGDWEPHPTDICQLGMI